jgi:diguanylate cyclase (GGDEF)-like protein
MGLLPMLTLGLALALFGVILHQRRQVARLNARLSEATRSDPLTGLLTRGAFDELLDKELKRSGRTGRPLSVIVADLDWLGLVNARHGHRTGDGVLQLVARDIQKWKRRIDSAARIGGEEFALLLPETDEDGAFMVAERLRRAAHRTFADEPLPVTISFGVASHPQHGDEREPLLESAVRAMGAAKEMGKDRTVIYNPEIARTPDSGLGLDAADLPLATVIGLAEALDLRDTGRTGHSQAVGRLCELIATELGLPPERVERVRLAGVLHDVGKIGVPDCLVTTPGPLDADQWQGTRTHPEVAARLLANPEFDDLRPWILAHHERPDGKGYPAGTAGESIPIEARILAVADAYEAMTADRAYRAPLGDQSARAELEAGAGSQFDAQVVAALLSALSRSERTASLLRAS